jgi:hypothetical protein
MLKWVMSIFFICAFIPLCSAQSDVHPEFPKQVIIGRDTFIDIPPFNYFEVFALNSIEGKTSVERLTLTPSQFTCLQPTTVEDAKAVIEEPIQLLFAGKNPCGLSEKALRKEIKRCKKCRVFAGSHLTMEFRCGQTMRRARMEVLEQDWFEKSPHTPENTSWSIRLLGRLDSALGSNVMERPVSPIGDENATSILPPETELTRGIRRGDYDTLFADTNIIASRLFADAQMVVPQPSVSLFSSTPFRPTEVVLPGYPAIAKAARVEGKLVVDMDVDAHGRTANVTFVGAKVLQSTTQKSISLWKFGAEAAGSHVQAVIQFELNCKEVVDTSVN